jgi:hypothetical protein
MKMTLQRNVYGIALPLRTMMEKNLVAEVRSLPLLVHSRLTLMPDLTLDTIFTRFCCDCCSCNDAPGRQTQDNHFPALTASELPLGGSMNIHAEILAGTDESIDVGDFMSGGKSTFAPRLFRFHVVSLSCS